MTDWIQHDLTLSADDTVKQIDGNGVTGGFCQPANFALGILQGQGASFHLT